MKLFFVATSEEDDTVLFQRENYRPTIVLRHWSKLSILSLFRACRRFDKKHVDVAFYRLHVSRRLRPAMYGVLRIRTSLSLFFLFFCQTATKKPLLSAADDSESHI